VSLDAGEFQPIETLRVLERHEVSYVLIGGLAAVLYGSPTYTNDADICPDRARTNLERLTAALRDLRARVRTDAEPDAIPFACDAEFLERMAMVNLVTTFGWLDVSFTPGGFPRGYSELIQHAVVFEVEDFKVRVAALRDVIASKEAANRTKDHAMLPHLYALEEEIAAVEREQRGGS
jgi:hypothetical protein